METDLYSYDMARWVPHHNGIRLGKGLTGEQRKRKK